jgi:transposase
MKNNTYIAKLLPRQRLQLQDTIKRGKHNARVITRARVLLESTKGLSAAAVAVRVGTTDRTVERIRARLDSGGFERALYDAPRSGAPVKIDDTTEAHLIATACSTPPQGRERWTLEMLKKKLSKEKKKNVSTVTIWHHLNDRQIKPWREKNVVHTEAYP